MIRDNKRKRNHLICIRMILCLVFAGSMIGVAGCSPQATARDCFEWDSDTIVGLTEKGKQQSHIVVPISAVAVEGEVFCGPALKSPGADGKYREENTLLESIRFQNPDTKINCTFYYCTSLSQVDLPANLTEIGANLFEGCISLREIPIPPRVAEIGDRAFYGCTSLWQVELGENLQTIGEFAFSYTALTSVVIPEGVTKIDDAFYSVWSLTEVQLPASLTDMDDAFSNNRQIITFKVKEGSYADIYFSSYAHRHFHKKEYF